MTTRSGAACSTGLSRLCDRQPTVNLYVLTNTYGEGGEAGAAGAAPAVERRSAATGAV